MKISFWIIFGGVFALAAYAHFSTMSELLHAEQKPWECRPYPGYCDIDTDWRPPAVKP